MRRATRGFPVGFAGGSDELRVSGLHARGVEPWCLRPPPPWPFGITALGSRGSGAARQREKGGASCERRQAGGYFYPPPKPAALTNGVMKY